MSDFLELAKLFGLPLAMTLTALVVMWRVTLVLWRDGKAQMEARIQDKERQIEDLEIQRDYYRDRWNQTLGISEAATVTATTLAKRRRGAGS